ncbi:hypothetical protein EDD86DRAFT_254345 [Gorgonomyces haynaldii]|nr:hypothetical protein EDD86DRAFT_254345 [Gorgonomyces haynaldii]
MSYSQYGPGGIAQPYYPNGVPPYVNQGDQGQYQQQPGQNQQTVPQGLPQPGFPPAGFPPTGFNPSSQQGQPSMSYYQPYSQSYPPPGQQYPAQVYQQPSYPSQPHSAQPYIAPLPYTPAQPSFQQGFPAQPIPISRVSSTATEESLGYPGYAKSESQSRVQGQYPVYPAGQVPAQSYPPIQQHSTPPPPQQYATQIPGQQYPVQQYATPPTTTVSPGPQTSGVYQPIQPSSPEGAIYQPSAPSAPERLSTTHSRVSTDPVSTHERAYSDAPSLKSNVFTSPGSVIEESVLILQKELSGNVPNMVVLDEMIAKRTVKEIDMIEKLYFETYQVRLSESIRSKSNGDLGKLRVALFTSWERFETQCILSFKKKPQHLLMSFLNRSNQEMNLLREAFRQVRPEGLVAYLEKETSSDLRDLFCSLCDRNRDEAGLFRDVEGDAQLLYQGGQDKKRRNEVFTDIFTSRSYPHLMQVFSRFAALYGKQMRDFISKHFSGNMQLCDAIICFPAVQALLFNEAMVGTGTNMDLLIACLVRCREPKFMAQVKEFFKMQFQNTSLSHRVKAEAAGGFGTLASMIVGL